MNTIYINNDLSRSFIDVSQSCFYLSENWHVKIFVSSILAMESSSIIHLLLSFGSYVIRILFRSYQHLNTLMRKHKWFILPNEDTQRTIEVTIHSVFTRSSMCSIMANVLAFTLLDSSAWPWTNRTWMIDITYWTDINTFVSMHRNIRWQPTTNLVDSKLNESPLKIKPWCTKHGYQMNFSKVCHIVTSIGIYFYFAWLTDNQSLI
jgi:hypothetical protein